MKQVWKYIIESGDFKSQLTYDIPIGGKIIYVDEQFGNICIWVEVDITKETEKRSFVVYGTGHNIKVCNNKKHVGSVKLNKGALIFHVYERIKG